jgi:hypothetical protein
VPDPGLHDLGARGLIQFGKKIAREPVDLPRVVCHKIQSRVPVTKCASLLLNSLLDIAADLLGDGRREMAHHNTVNSASQYMHRSQFIPGAPPPAEVPISGKEA